MKIVEQTSSRLVLREWPLLYIANVVIFVILGTACLMDKSSLLVGLACFFVALLLATGAHLRTIIFDRDSSRLSILRRGLFWKRAREVALHEVRDVEIYNPAGRKRMTFLSLVLKSNKRILLVDSSRKKEAFATLMETIRSFLPQQGISS